MNCTDFDRRVEEYLDGVLSPGESETLARHVAECRLCASQLALLERAERSMRSVRPQPAPSGMLEAVYARVQAPDRPGWRLFAWPWPFQTMAAATAAAGVVAMVWSLAGGSQPPDGPGRVVIERGPEMAREPEPTPVPDLGRAAATTVRPERDRGGMSRSRQGRAPSSILPRDPGPRRAAPATRNEGEPPEEDLSPALLAGLQRPVTVVFRQEPVRDVARRLTEAADVPVRIDAPKEARVSLDAREAPLWLALEKMAEQTGGVIEPAGNGVALRVTGTQLAQSQVMLQPQAVQQTGRRNAANAYSQQPVRAEVWSPRFGRLPEMQFAPAEASAGNAPQTLALAMPSVPMVARQRRALGDEQPDGQGLARPEDRAPAARPPSRADARRFRAGPQGPAALVMPGGAGGLRGEAEGFAGPAAGPAEGGVRALLGRLTLIRLNRRAFAAFQPQRLAGGVLTYRLWFKRGDGRLDRGRVLVRTGRSNLDPAGGFIPLPGSPRGLRWAPAGSGAINLFPTGSMAAVATGLLGVRGLDAASPRWRYRR